MDTVEESFSVIRHHPLAQCEKCPLYSEDSYVRTHFPSPEDVRVPESRRLAIVGEAPGYNERIRGIPFTGASGQLLNRVLDYHGISRASAIVTNACSCRPADNATPPKAAMAACRPRLLAELDSATEVLALGNSAARSILQTTSGITVLRSGAPKEWMGKKVVCTFHPAACLRQGDLFPHLVNDTGKLIHEIPSWEPPKYVVLDDEETALQAIEQLWNLSDELVIDIECGIDKDVSFDHPNNYDMLCVGVAYAKGKAAIFGENSLTEKVWEAMKELFKNKKLDAHNGKFDLAGLYRYLGKQVLHFDTMLASYCLDERRGIHGLKYLGPELLGTPEWDRELARYLGKGKNYGDIPRPVLYKYNAYDVAVTWDLREYFESELERQGLRLLHDFLVRASNELMYVELNGIAIDLAYNFQLTEEFLADLAELEEAMDKFCARDYDKKGGINPRSPKQLKEFFKDAKTPVGDTTAETLKRLFERLSGSGGREPVVQFLDLLLQHRRDAKLFSTYVKGITSRTYRGRVFTTYLLHGTTSGRLASRNPNLQNIVRNKRIKRQFVVSRPTNVLIHGDYKQVEGRVMTTYAQDEYLRGIFADPERDLFDELGSRLYKVHRSELTKDQRVRVKAYFYGLGYGRESYSIAMEWRIPPREAERDVRAFKELIPGITSWQDDVRRRVLSGEDLTTSFGRRRRFWLITKENRKDVLNEALAFLPQSTASDICLRAFTRIRPRLRGLAHMRLTIHDALVAEGSEDDREEIMSIMQEEMVRSANEWTNYVPFEVDFTYGKSWADL